jgi:hypothetical protein
MDYNELPPSAFYIIGRLEFLFLINKTFKVNPRFNRKKINATYKYEFEKVPPPVLYFFHILYNDKDFKIYLLSMFFYYNLLYYKNLMCFCKKTIRIFVHRRVGLFPTRRSRAHSANLRIRLQTYARPADHLPLTACLAT